MNRRFLTRGLLISTSILLAWVIVAWLIAPSVIRSAYAGESFGLINRLITGQASHSVDEYLALWMKMAWRSSALLAIGLAAIVLTAAYRERAAALVRRFADALPEVTPLQALQVSLSIAIISGLAEATNAIVRHRLQHLPTGDVTGGEAIWMAPLAASVSIGGVALLLLLIALVVRPIDPHRVVVRLVPVVATLLVAWSFTRAMYVGISPYAGVIVALGAGVATTRALRRWPVLTRRSGRAVLVAAIMLTVWGLAVPPWRRLTADWAKPDRPAPPAGAPNVLVVIWDAVRAASLSTYGNERPTTPVLDRLATSGLVFERAFATAPWSLPSHASMFTGRYPNELSVGYALPLDERVPTVAEEMARHGWATAGFTGNLFYGSPSYGIARGFDWYDANPPVNGYVVARTWWLSEFTIRYVKRRFLNYHQQLLRRSAPHVSNAFLEWLNRRDGRPFFAVLNHFDAHEPYLAPEPFNLAFSKTQPRYWFNATHRTYPQETLEQFRTAYETCILYLDHELGRLTAALEERGLLDNTLVIVTSDHGEAFGEHGPTLVEHSRSLYSPVLRVPMVLSFPSRIAEGFRRSEVVSIRDIPATVLHAAGIKPTREFPGVSLLDYATRDSVSARHTAPRLSVVEHFIWGGTWPDWPASNGNMFSVAQNDHHLIEDPDGKERFYDIMQDPWESRDLAATPEAGQIRAHLRHVLDSLAPRVDGKRRVRIGR